MNENLKRSIRGRHDKGQVDYWRQRAEKAERELAETKALLELEQRVARRAMSQGGAVIYPTTNQSIIGEWSEAADGTVLCNGVSA